MYSKQGGDDRKCHEAISAPSEVETGNSDPSSRAVFLGRTTLGKPEGMTTAQEPVSRLDYCIISGIRTDEREYSP